MSVTDLPEEQLIALALEAISDRAAERLRPLLAEDIVIATGRAEHRGVEAALAWARRSYAHLDRRYQLDRLEPRGSGLLGIGRVEYVWRDSGEVGDVSLAFFSFQIRDRLLARIFLSDDLDAAQRSLDAAS
jgi:hypothetical protein